MQSFRLFIFPLFTLVITSYLTISSVCTADTLPQTQTVNELAGQVLMSQEYIDLLKVLNKTALDRHSTLIINDISTYVTNGKNYVSFSVLDVNHNVLSRKIIGQIIGQLIFSPGTDPSIEHLWFVPNAPPPGGFSVGNN